MQQLTNQKAWKPWKSILYFIGLILILFFPYSILISYLGIPGLVLGQLLFLLYAIVITKLHKTPLKEVFPIHKIRLLDVVGVLILAIGCILLNLLFAGIGIVLFPSDLSTVAEASEILHNNSVPPIVMALIVALTPAICEESIMRGGLFSYFRGFKRPWVSCILVGIAFGILHTSAIKFLPTAFLGAIMAYLMVKRNNIVLPAMLHFFNNFIVELIGSLGGTTDVSADSKAEALKSLTDNPMMTIGTFIFIAFLAPVLFMLGAQLMRIVKPTAVKWVVASLLSVTMFFTGIGMLLCFSLGQTIITQFTGSQTITDSFVPYEFTVEEGGTYQIVMTGDLTGEGADIVIVDEEEMTIFEKKYDSGMYMFNENIELEGGTYYIVFTANDTSVSTDMSITGEVVMR